MWVLVISSSSSKNVGPLTLTFVFFPCLSPPPGNILDYSHHPWTRILLRQFWNQPLPNHIRWSCQEGGWSVQARKTCHHTFCQSGVFLKDVNSLWLALHEVYDWDVCLYRAPNVAASFLLPRSLRASSVLTASWHSSMITILSSQVTPSRTSRAEAVGWRGEKRKGAVWQSHPAHHSASTSPPGVATIAQAAPVVWWPPALLYPPA